MGGIFDIKLKDDNIKDRELPGFSDKKNEGSFIDSGPLGPENSKIHKKRIGPPVNKNRVYTIATICLVIVLFIISYVIYLQTFKGNYYRNIAEGNRIRNIPVVANRGLIYDRNEKALTQNIANFSLTIVPGDLPKDKIERERTKNSLLSNLREVYTQGDSFKKEVIEEINKIFNESNYYDYRPRVLIEKIDYLTSMKLMLAVDKLPGINLRSNAIRKYINPNNSFSHIIGYVDNITEEEYKAQSGSYTITDFIGRTGLEKYYEDTLKGENGQKRVEVDSLGRQKRVESLTEPVSGKNIILSLDFELQKKVINVLKKYVKSNTDVGAGAAALINPQNGEVLALSSWPTYNNNFFTIGSDKEGSYQNMEENPYRPFVFRAIAGEYPPGSAIKPVWATAGLMEGVINKSTTVLSTGGISVGKWFFADWKSGGHGRVNLIKALAESVNTFFYYLGGGYKDFKGLGIGTMKQYAKDFGLTKKTGIDLPNESRGLVADPEWKKRVKGEPWYIGDTYHIAIGQGDILVTPIQVANYISAIANGGILYRPHLVTHIFGSNDNDKEINYNPIKEKLANKKDIELVQQGLRAAVKWGSARALSKLDIKVAGKTGTAEVGGNKNPHSWFTGFAPFKKPKVAIAIIFENGGDGTKMAVPAAYEILKYWDKNIR